MTAVRLLASVLLALGLVCAVPVLLGGDGTPGGGSPGGHREAPRVEAPRVEALRVDAPRVEALRDPDRPGELLLSAQDPRALVWNGERHRGALATRDGLLLLSEQRDGGGQSATVLALGTVLPTGRFDHLALGHDDGSVYASAAHDPELHGYALDDGRARLALPAGGLRPGLVFHHPVLHRLVSFNAGSATLTLFDMGSKAFEGLIPLGDSPVAVRLAPGGALLGLLPARRELILIALRPLRILMRWALPETCLHPLDLDIDPAGQRALLACADGVIAVFGLREGEWQAGLRGSSDAAVVRVYWDGVHARVLALGEDGSVNLAGAAGAAPSQLARIPPGALAEYDAAGAQLVWAVRERQGGGIRAGLAPLP